MVYSIRPLIIRQIVKTRASDPINAKRIESCGGGATSAMKVLSANNVLLGLATDCLGVFSGGLCNSAFRRNIVFTEPFSAPPHVIVVPETVSQQGGCVAGATDKVVSYPTNITATGFTLVGAGSPDGTCGGMHSWSSAAVLGWVAIGQ
jgi:hypothetical protein